jgi:hypothetical protein
MSKASQARATILICIAAIENNMPIQSIRKSRIPREANIR